MARKRFQIIHEISSSENNYLFYLSHLRLSFYEPLLSHRLAGDVLMDERDIHSVFSPCETIYEFNKIFEMGIRDRLYSWSNVQRIGDLFFALSTQLKLYAGYVIGYRQSLKVLYQWIERDEALKDWISKKEECVGQTIGALFILPIQRLTRYILLLEEMLKYTWVTHCDYEPIKLAILHLKKVTDYLNERRRDADNLENVLEIRELFDDLSKTVFLLTPSLRYVMKGDIKLRKSGSKKVHQRNLFLFNEILLISKESNTLITIQYQIQLDTLHIDLEQQNGLRLLTEKLNLVLLFETPKDGQDWLELIVKTTETLLSKNLKKIEGVVPRRMSKHPPKKLSKSSSERHLRFKKEKTLDLENFVNSSNQNAPVTPQLSQSDSRILKQRRREIPVLDQERIKMARDKDSPQETLSSVSTYNRRETKNIKPLTARSSEKKTVKRTRKKSSSVTLKSKFRKSFNLKRDQ